MNLSPGLRPEIDVTYWDDSFGNSMARPGSDLHQLLWNFVYFLTGHHPAEGPIPGPVEPDDNQF